MAARSVFKLFSKTCSYTLNPACPPPISSLAPEQTYHRQQRSYSQPPQKHCRNARREHFFQLRKISKSLENLREARYKEEEYEEREDYEEDARSARRNSFPVAVDMSLRDPAKEFKEKYIPEEKSEEGNPIYELTDGTRNQANYYDVLQYMKQLEITKIKRMFPHLQPNNLRPYGSNDNLHYPGFSKKHQKIVYPVMNTPNLSDSSRRKKFEEIQYKEFSSYRPQKEYPGFEETKKVAVCEKTSAKNTSVSKKNYSTACTKKKSSVKSGVNLKGPKLTLSTSFTRKSSTALLKKKKDVKQTQIDEAIENSLGMIDQFYKRISEYKAKKKGRENLFNTKSTNEVLLSRSKNKLEDRSRGYNTYNKPATINCEDYVTVKLGELQEECRKAKRCRPKKISFGRLPKLLPPDCPCIEDVPLKEGKPLERLKKRFDVKDHNNRCTVEELCTTPRADANYKIKPKTLPKITPLECPCDEREMTDLIIRRLPKKKVPEPKRVCCCVEKECCPPRADDTLKTKKKCLPKLVLNECPCIETIAFKDVPLHRLKPIMVKEPERDCPKPTVCEENVRADRDLKITPKVLPVIKGECPCPAMPPMNEGSPLTRLKKVEYVEKPRESCEVTLCADAVRADQDLQVKQKKLPTFIPQSCPCIEQEIPSVLVKLRRLQMRNHPTHKKKICVEEVCGSRADDGMVVKPKQLPVIHPKECPCVDRVLVDVPPLKKLIPKPVEEPPKVCVKIEECITPRSDEKMKVKRKNLPVLPPGSCPCIEPEPPLDVKPLPKLKKKKVTHKRVCPAKVEECYPRADENLKVKIKRLPKLEVPDCPCLEPPPPEDIKPLTRLKKVHVPEPAKVCPKIDDCDEIPRADEDDWLYWKRVEVKSAECVESSKTHKRSFSTSSKRHYSTSMKSNRDLFKLKYDVPQLPVAQHNEKSYNIIIDIKPSAPLILTQKPLELSQKDSLESGLNRKMLKRSKSEPVDCVTFVIYKSNNLGGPKHVKEGSSDVSQIFNTINRFISTCSTLYEYSERTKDKLKDHTTPSCECPPNDAYLQPKNPIISEKETFITPYPSEDLIDDSAKKGRMYYRTRKDEMQCQEKEEAECKEEEEPNAICEVEEEEVTKGDKPLTLWEKIVNYFKARPDCPSPEEFKKLRLKEEAEKAASKAGLCLYDPKEMLRKNEKELPKVITAKDSRK